MILTVEDLKKYVPLQTSSVDVTEMAAFETKALYKHFPFYLGIALVDTIAGSNPPSALMAKVKPVLANVAYLEAVPFFDVVLTSTGFGVVSMDGKIAPASRERVMALKDGCLQSANDFMDQLLYYLESNQATYTTWNKSSLNTGSLIASAAAFVSLAHQDMPRPRFVKLIPEIRAIENTILQSTLSKEFIDELRAGTDTAVKPDIQMALANMALAAEEKTDDKKSAAYKKIGERYLAKAMAYLKSHLTTYSTFSTYGYEAPYNNDDENFESEPGFFIAGITG
jgi:hypothetical protein